MGPWSMSMTFRSKLLFNSNTLAHATMTEVGEVINVAFFSSKNLMFNLFDLFIRFCNYWFLLVDFRFSIPDLLSLIFDF